MCTFCFCFVEDADQRFGNLETRTGQVEDQVHSLEGNFEIRHALIPLWAMNISSSNLFFLENTDGENSFYLTFLLVCTFIRDVAHFIFFLCILGDTAQRFGNVETRTGQVEDQVHILEGNFEIRLH